MCNESCFKQGTPKMYLLVFLVVAIIASSMSCAVYGATPETAANTSEQTATGENVTATDEDVTSTSEAVENNTSGAFSLTNETFYPDYLSQNEANGFSDYTGEDVSFDLKKAEIPEVKVKNDDGVTETVGKDTFIRDTYTPDQPDESGNQVEQTSENGIFVWELSELGWAEFYVTVTEKAFYNIEIEYYTPEGSLQTAQRTLNIAHEVDGVYEANMPPFYEAATVDFMRKWKDDGALNEIKLNKIGDQVRPRQVQIFEFQTMRISDHDGKYSLPLKYAFDKGNYRISLLYQYEPIVIKSIKLVKPVQLPTYEEKLNEWKGNGYKEATQSSIQVQGESPIYKTSPALRKDGSSDPAATPSYENGSTRLNVMGQTWASINQSLTWDVEATEAGLYKIALRCYVSFADGIPIYRQVKINGEIPYQEFECYEIPFDDWNCITLQKGDQPLLVYLEEGHNTIEMTVKLGALTDIMNSLQGDANKLSTLVREITKIVGTNPDPNFEFRLEETVPNLISRLQEIVDSFETQIDRISALSTKRPSAINNFINMSEQLQRMIDNPDIISKNYGELTLALTNVSLWIQEFGKLPMQLDYIEFLPPSEEVEIVKSTFFERLGTAVQMFVVSFSKDYDSVTGGGDDSDDYIDVWVARGKEWATVLSQLVDEDFLEKYQTSVKMNVLPSGQLNASASSVLLLALASGTGPDACLGVAANLPVEYGMRGAIYPLSDFEGFSEVFDPERDSSENRFLNGIMIPFLFEDKYYGLPETMDFQCLYYRKDILEDNNLEVPSTWTDVYSKVLPVLNNANMDFYYAGGYNPFLFQNGGEYYTEDNQKSAWGSEAALTGFRQWTDLYTIYDVPVTADFYSRFRTGQMPIGVGGIDIYTKLVSTAPEIAGKWGVAPIPGTPVYDENGDPVIDSDTGEQVINRASGGGTTACIILNDSDKKERAWDFLEWYTSDDIQVSYANDIKSIIGPEAIWASANKNAFNDIPWSAELKEVIGVYQEWYQDAPNVVGGYIVARYLENARVAVVVEKKLYRPSLERAVKEIDSELKNKNDEFERRRALEQENSNN